MRCLDLHELLEEVVHPPAFHRPGGGQEKFRVQQRADSPLVEPPRPAARRSGRRTRGGEEARRPGGRPPARPRRRLECPAPASSASRPQARRGSRPGARGSSAAFFPDRSALLADSPPRRPPRSAAGAVDGGPNRPPPVRGQRPLHWRMVRCPLKLWRKSRPASRSKSSFARMRDEEMQKKLCSGKFFARGKFFYPGKKYFLPG